MTLRKPVPAGKIEHCPSHRVPIHPTGAAAKYLGEPLTNYGLDIFLNHLLDAELESPSQRK